MVQKMGESTEHGSGWPYIVMMIVIMMMCENWYLRAQELWASDL